MVGAVAAAEGAKKAVQSFLRTVPSFLFALRASEAFAVKWREDVAFQGAGIGEPVGTLLLHNELKFSNGK